MPNKMNTLAIDVGTHAMRAAIYTIENGFLKNGGIVEVPLGLNDLGNGHIEQDPAEFIAGLHKLISELISPGDHTQYQLAIACQRSSVLAWCKNTGEALSPILSWQDTRSIAKVRALTKTQREFIQHHTGLPVNAHFGASKIATLAAATPKNRDVIYGPLAAWLVHYLTHRPACDLVNACRTLCVDIHNTNIFNWGKELCEIWGITPQALPPVVPNRTMFGELKITGQDARAFNGQLNVVTGDQNAAFIALNSQGQQAGFNNPLVINIGSGAFVLGARAHLQEHSPHHNLLHAPLFASEENIEWLQEGTVNSSGTELTRWREANSDLSESALFQQLPTWLAASNDDIPLYLPTAAGIGSPFWISRFKASSASFYNLDCEPCSPSLSQQAVAVVESIAFLLTANIDAMQGSLKPYDGIIFAGGLSRLAGLVERICQLADLKGWVSDDFEATLLGAAIACDRKNHKASIKGRIVAANNTAPLLKKRYQRYIALIQKQQD